MTQRHAANLAAENAVNPAALGERIVTLDFIRGVAVMGILLANIVAFGQPLLAYLWPPAFVEQPYSQADAVFWVGQLILVDGKFRGLFTLLFGAGMMLFLERAAARGDGDGDSLQLRRLLWLLAFGVIHYFLIWRGDILSLYAFAGMLALTARHWDAQAKWRAGLVLTVAGAVLMSLMMAVQYLDTAASGELGLIVVQELDTAAREAALMTGDSYVAIARDTLANGWGDWLWMLVAVGLTETFGLILLGMALYQKGLFSGAIPDTVLRTWGWAGVVAGTLATVPLALWPYNHGFPLMLTMLVFVGLAGIPRIAVVLGLMALLVSYAPRLARGWLGERIVAAGRMAFSNYLGTSIVMMLVFHGWAGGQFGQHGRLGLLGFVLAAWVVMLAWSKPWLERYRHGPLEWVWRCLTYGRLFALRR